MSKKQDISRIIDTKITYKIDDFYDPTRIIKVINKTNKIKLNYKEFSILNKESNKIEIRSKISCKEYCGTVTISYQIDNHKRYIIGISVVVSLFLVCLIVLPLIALSINNSIMLWISLGLCGLCLLGVVAFLAFWPRSSRLKRA